MDLTTISNALSEAGIHICPVCGTPYDPYHSRQKTCGDTECKKIYHNEYVKRRAKRLKEEDPERWNKYHAKANKRWRRKKKAIAERDEELQANQERWQKQSEFDKKVSEYGHEYGKRSAEKLLATIPKIDVTMGNMKEERK